MVLILLCGECKRGNHKECGGFLPPTGGKEVPGGALCCCDCKIATESVEAFMRERRERENAQSDA